MPTASDKTPGFRWLFPRFTGRLTRQRILPRLPHRHLIQLTAAILVFSCLQAGGRGYSQTITLSVKNARLEKVFAEIQKQSGYTFAYTKEALQETKAVTLTVKNAALTEVVELALKGQGLGYTLVDKIVVIKKQASGRQSANSSLTEPELKDIKGKVTDEKGLPIAGATVTVRGTNTATSTAVDGTFEFNDLDEKATLIVTSIGYEPRTVKLTGTKITIELRVVAQSMKEVVISTGYQRISSERFVGSYSQLDSASFHKRPGMNIIDRLDGTTTGILFDKKNDQFGIQIRGITTLGYNNTSTSPLIVVDNFPMGPEFDISKINPNDVESVTVLKDAAATSIWGARAGNGVIVVSLKKARFNQKIQVSVSSNVTITEKPDLFYTPSLNSSDFIDVETYLFNNGFYDEKLTNNFTYPVVSPVIELLDQRKRNLITEEEATSKINKLRTIDVRNNINKWLFRPAILQQHYLGLTGGTNNIAYNLSAGLNNKLNRIKGSQPDNQYTINSNVTFQLFKKLEIYAGLLLSHDVDKSYSSEDRSILSSPYLSVADENGQGLPIPYIYRQSFVDTVGAGKFLDGRFNQLDEIRNADYKRTSSSARVNTSITYAVNNWLKAFVNVQYATSQLSFRNHKSLATFETRRLINRFTNPYTTDPNKMYPVPLGGILDLQNAQRSSYNIRGGLSFTKGFGADHRLSGMLSSEISETKGNSSFERIYGYDDNISSYKNRMDYVSFHPVYYGAYPFQAEQIPAVTSYSEDPIARFVSLVANASYTYKSRYNLYASARRDGANIFGVNTNNRWKPLWSVGASWEISKESFYKVDWMPDLRLRVTTGYSGNVNNSLSGKFIMSFAQDPAFLTSYPYASAGRVPNPDLKWEQVRTLNVGVDFTILKNRISGSIDVYRRKSTDVISTVFLPPSVGANSFDLNYASMKVAGFDLILNGSQRFGQIQWNSSLGISYAKTTILEFRGGALTTTNTYKTKDFVEYGLNAAKGQMPFALSSYRWGGLDPANGNPQGILDGKVTKDYLAIFNDSLDNQVFHGSATPLFSSFWRNEIRWKNLSLTVGLIGRFKYYFRQPTLNLDYGELWGGENYLSEYNDRWKKPGDEQTTNVPSMNYPPLPDSKTERNGFYKYSEINVRRGDNIRIQDVNISYQWNSRSSTFPIQNIRLFFYINNLNIILWRAASSSYDPDYSGGTGSGITNGPPPKTFTGGITINF